MVEILSPSTAGHDRAIKLALYAEAGVPEVWFGDRQAKTVEVLKLKRKKYILDAILSADRVLTSSQFPGWEMAVSQLFDFRSRF